MDFRKIVRQTVTDARADKAYTALYLGGVALSIATIMIFAVIYYVRIAPIYPEVNRNRTLSIVNMFCKAPDNTQAMGSMLSYKAVSEWFYNLENVEAVSAIYYRENVATIIPDNGTPEFSAMIKATDPEFFRIYELKFVAGKPFTESCLTNALRNAVVSDMVARRLYGSPGHALGKTVRVNDRDYSIVGVVKRPSLLTPDSFGDIYFPYSTVPGYDQGFNSDAANGMLGSFTVTMLVADDGQEKALREEIATYISRNNSNPNRWTMDIHDQPRTYLQCVFQPRPGADFSWWNVIRENMAMLVVLLLVPALNMGAMIAGRMESRLTEMGVRKAFGARRHSLLSQVLWENFLLTLTGGIIGLIAAWIALVLCRAWIFNLVLPNNSLMADASEITVNGEMIFAPAVFACALSLCIVLNLMAAYIPARRALRHPIVSSLNQKR